jgi:hypothetical protein
MPELPVLDDAWIVAQRGPRHAVDPFHPYALSVEPERMRDGHIEDVATIFITNKECPFRCLMCDLWKNTTTARVPPGAVAEQIAWALEQLPPVGCLKLYNSGNFFDTQAIPRSDWPRIGDLMRRQHTVIVESHPRLVTPKCLHFADLLAGQLDVAMGLETIDPAVLPRLNKRMTLVDFERATRSLTANAINVRAFILLRAPFQNEHEAVQWAKRSLEWAFSIGVECCVIIPTRAGNGALEWLQARSHFAPPALESLEEVLEFGIGLCAGRVFADLWDIERICAGVANVATHIERLRQMNLNQRSEPRP